VTSKSFGYIREGGGGAGQVSMGYPNSNQVGGRGIVRV